MPFHSRACPFSAARTVFRLVGALGILLYFSRHIEVLGPLQVLEICLVLLETKNGAYAHAKEAIKVLDEVKGLLVV